MESTGPLHDIREEASRVNSASASQADLPAIHASPQISSRPIGRRRQGSSVSRVSIDHFDPAGVRDLRRTMSQASEHPAPGAPERMQSLDSDQTLSEAFDFEKVLQQVVQRRTEADIKSRELGVGFQNLRVVGLGAANIIPTLGTMFLPSTIMRSIQDMRHPPTRDILSGFEGVVRPGSMTLVLGRPGSGCTTLLKTLTNNRDGFHAIEGDVYYDSLSPAEVEKSFRGEISYCPEDDVHFPTLSVSQTLGFAAKARAPSTRLADPATGKRHTREQFTSGVVKVLTTIFGLTHTTNTPVGNAAIRGVSGGEKKRVSIAEALAIRSRLAAWDNSTRGLDSSTALEFVRALRIATDVDNMSTIVSIYQAGESLYTLFDKVILIYDGRMVYNGPADQARQYFVDMGYAPVAERQTTADFLVSVTDPVGRVLQPGFEGRPVPRSADEFAVYFAKSTLGLENKQDVAAYYEQFVAPGKPDQVAAYKDSVKAEMAKNTRQASPYTISIPMQVRAVMLRRVQIIKGNPLVLFMNLASFILQAVITGTIFLRVPNQTSAYFSRGGVLFFALLFSALSTMAEIPTLYAQRPIVLRHMRSAMYHPFVESLALTLVDIPITFITMMLFSIVLYFIVGLQQSAGQFFIFFLFIFMMTLTMKSFFRAIASAFASEAAAQSLAGLSVLGLVIYTGYMIPRRSMVKGLSWITYINPLRYGFEAVLTNEFHTVNGECSNLVPFGAGYDQIPLANKVCTTVGSVPGLSTVNGDRYAEVSYNFVYSKLWMNFGIVCAFWVGFTALYLILTERNAGSASDISVPLFKHGSKACKKGDEENGASTISSQTEKPVEATIKAVPTSDDVFSWHNLRYTVPIPGSEDRRLLDDVSGYVAPGQLTALMGESGAGKTTLLNVLAQRVSTGVIQGDRWVNGQPLPRDFGSQTGYCQQMDTHLPTATVREALLFSAKLRQPASVPLSEKVDYVEQCLVMCGLEAYADASVGTLGIEMRKRTTIAVELAAKPALLLFLDEPTSGLDSQSSWRIMAFLKKLAENGQAILCTIHQPSAELFQVFDRLLLLKKGGKTAYFGPIGYNSTTMIDYFQRNGGRTCESHENPAEFMLEVIGAGATATTKFDWAQLWVRSSEAAGVQNELERIHAEGRSKKAVEAQGHSEYATSWVYQTRELLGRAFVRNWRDMDYLIAKLALNILGGLFIGFSFYKSPDTPQGTQNRLFAVFMSTILGVPLANQLQVPFINVRSIYLIRERPSRMYSWSALVTAQIISEIPLNIIGSSLYFLCWFWAVGFANDRAGYTYLLLSVIYPIYYTTIGQAVASMVSSAELAAVLFAFLFSFVLNFNGVMQPFAQLGWWQWMYRLSPSTYIVGGLLGQSIGRTEITCSDIELVSITPPSGQSCGDYMGPYISRMGGYLTDPSAIGSCDFCSISSSDQFLGSSFNIFYSERWRNLGIIVAFCAFNIFAIYAFTWFFQIRTGSVFDFLKRKKKTTQKTIESESKA